MCCRIAWSSRLPTSSPWQQESMSNQGDLPFRRPNSRVLEHQGLEQGSPSSQVSDSNEGHSGRTICQAAGSFPQLHARADREPVPAGPWGFSNRLRSNRQGTHLLGCGRERGDLDSLDLRAHGREPEEKPRRFSLLCGKVYDPGGEGREDVARQRVRIPPKSPPKARFARPDETTEEDLPQVNLTACKSDPEIGLPGLVENLQDSSRLLEDACRAGSPVCLLPELRPS